MITPSNVDSSNKFMGSVFQNSECETILRNIVLLQKNANPDQWTQFSWEDYKEFCSHNVTESEKGVLDAMVNGGKPVWNTTTVIDAGWLSFSDGVYKFTDKMTKMLEKDFC